MNPFARLRSLLRGSRKHATPMSCPEVGRLLQHYLDGELDDAATRAIAAHLDDCVRCGLEAETYERIITSITGLRRALPADSLDRLRDFGARLAAGDEPDNADLQT